MADAVGIKRCNLDKAIQKKLLPPSARPWRSGQPSTRSERAEGDAAAAADMGMACVRVEERAMAACGLLSGAETRFEECVDLERGGVLCALPALAANGLFAHLAPLDAPREGGFYYRLLHVFTLLALMALLRVKTVEALRRGCPGEFGRLLGLDRVPEVRCLRARLEAVASNPAAVAVWANALSKAWMEAGPGLAGTALRRRACAGLPRRENRTAAPLRRQPPALPARRDRLLGERPGGQAVLLRRPSGGRRAADGAARRDRSAPAPRCARATLRGKIAAEKGRLSDLVLETGDLEPGRKLVLDTVRMIAYRAETALAALARPELASPEQARSTVKALFNTAADLRPDPQRKELQILLHPLAEPRLNRMAEAVLVALNETQFTYPGTELRMVYQMLTPADPPGD